MITRLFLTAAISVALSALALAQEHPAAKPTEQHAVLQKEVGIWETETTWWPNGPDGPSMKCSGIETNSSIGDGLWVVREFVGKLGNHVYEGSGQYGYDLKTKKYIGTWVDSINYRVTFMEGTFNPEKNELIMFSQKEVIAGQVLNCRSVTKYTGDNKKDAIIYAELPGGKEFKMLEATSIRQSTEKP